MPLDLDDYRSARPEHPWLDEFERDPEARFDEIIRGIALIPPYGLADPLTILPSLFGPLHAADPLRGALDRALIGWLDRRRTLPHADRRRYGFKRYWSDVVEALALALSLDLPVTRAALRDRYFEFLQWVDGQDLSSSVDPRARLWLALTPDQPTPRFRSLWVRICRQTGEGIFPDHYLGIGLLGLRRLPGEERQVLEQVLGGLAAWAGHLPDRKNAKRAFLIQVRALQWIYPQPGRTPWQKLAEPVIRAHEGKPFAQWWAEELSIRLDRRPAGTGLAPPPLEALTRLIARLRVERIDTVEDDIRRIILGYRKYAEATGNSHFLARTAANIGGRIIDDAPGLTLDLVSQALEWDPNNPVLWNLWGRALVGLGRTRLAEAVFWEAVRRFPDDEPSLVELARLIEALGRSEEAQAVLREAVRRFKDNEASHVELARLLAGTGRLDEAVTVLRDFVRRSPRHGPSHVELARLLARRGDWDAAITLLRRFVERHPDDRVSVTALGHLLVDSGKPFEAHPLLDDLRELRDHRGVAELSKAIAKAERGEPVPMPQPDYGIPLAPQDELADKAAVAAYRPLCTDSRVTRADFTLSEAADPYVRSKRRDELRSDLRDLLAAEPDHAYARVVYFDRLAPPEAEACGMLADFPRLYELRLSVALRWRKPEELVRLDAEFPERAAVTGLALSALDAAEDGRHLAVAGWLLRPAPPADDLLGAYVHRAVRAALTQAGSGLEDRNAVADDLPRISAEISDVLHRAVRLIGAQERERAAA